ncbi:hypothetical protein [Candidatus Poriferisodalis sp.]|uniref:hypothetical protein n=1 Tax=Candidatus Poriferisodalis sp. TaxID=3101277 RepID=UPI003B015E76
MAHTPDTPETDAPERTDRELAEPIPDSFENVVAAVMRAPAKKNWRYERDR